MQAVRFINFFKEFSITKNSLLYQQLHLFALRPRKKNANFNALHRVVTHLKMH
jgi:hypothetical protein